MPPEAAVQTRRILAIDIVHHPLGDSRKIRSHPPQVRCREKLKPPEPSANPFGDLLDLFRLLQRGHRQYVFVVLLQLALQLFGQLDQPARVFDGLARSALRISSTCDGLSRGPDCWSPAALDSANPPTGCCAQARQRHKTNPNAMTTGGRRIPACYHSH